MPCYADADLFRQQLQVNHLYSPSGDVAPADVLRLCETGTMVTVSGTSSAVVLVWASGMLLDGRKLAEAQLCATCNGGKVAHQLHQGHFRLLAK